MLFNVLTPGYNSLAIIKPIHNYSRQYCHPDNSLSSFDCMLKEQILGTVGVASPIMRI